MKYALIIGNNKDDDQKLAQLKTPAAYNDHALPVLLAIYIVFSVPAGAVLILRR